MCICMRMCACVFDCVFDCECRSALSFSAASQTCDLIETHRGVLRPSTGHLCTLSLPFKVVQPPFFPHTHTHTHTLSLFLTRCLSLLWGAVSFFFLFGVWTLASRFPFLCVCGVIWLLGASILTGVWNRYLCMSMPTRAKKAMGHFLFTTFFFFLALLPPLVFLTCVVGKGWRLATSLAATCASSEKSP